MASFPPPAFCVGDGSVPGHWLRCFACVGCQGLLWASGCLAVAAAKSNITLRKAREHIAGNALHTACAINCTKPGNLTSLSLSWEVLTYLIRYFTGKECCWKIRVLILKCSTAMYVGDHRRQNLIRKNKMPKIQTFCGTEVFSNGYIFNSAKWNHL